MTVVQGVGRINAVSINQDNVLTGFTMAVVIDGRALDVSINAPEGHTLDSAAAEGLNLRVEVS